MTFPRTPALLLLATLAATAAAALALHPRDSLHLGQFHALAQSSTPPAASPPQPAAAPSQPAGQPPAAVTRPQPPAAPAPPGASPATPATRALIFLDPAHGGPEPGAALGNNVAEKDVTLALAGRLRAALAAAGFTVLTTRDADPAAPLTPDQRASAANRTHALACIVLHATAAGNGVHLFTSTLAPAPPAIEEDNSGPPEPFLPIDWDSAQAGYVEQSRQLADLLKSTLAKAGLPIPTLSRQAPLRPLDNLMCPAVAVELAPGTASDGSAVSAADADYQQRVAASLAAALQSWRTQNAAPAGAAP